MTADAEEAVGARSSQDATSLDTAPAPEDLGGDPTVQLDLRPVPRGTVTLMRAGALARLRALVVLAVILAVIGALLAGAVGAVAAAVSVVAREALG